MDLGREVLTPNDGWASEGAGMTGGSAAAENQVYTVTNGVPSSTSPSTPCETNHVWIDHNTFRDRTTADDTLPLVFGVLFQVHDGLLDITNASDFVTVSWNRFENHDKLMLIGSSDNAPADVGKLRVTLHHNLFDTIGQRAPRVRFGRVHVYNNLYPIGNLSNYQYSWGVGIQSQIYAENNFFDIDESIAPGGIIERLNGTSMFETGTLVDRTLGHDNGIPHGDAVSLLAEYNAVTDPDIVDASGTTWIPALFLDVDRTKEVPNLVRKCAGPFGPSCDVR